MKTKKELRKELLKYLKDLKKNSKKYRVLGFYKDDEGNQHNVSEECDTMEGCCEWWNEVESYVREPRYHRLMNDPQVLEECKEHYDDWDDMDEGERDDALDEHVIESYCSYEDMDEFIDLFWFNQIELIDDLIDEIKSKPNLGYDPIVSGGYEINNDNLITMTDCHTGVTKTALMLEQPTWELFHQIWYDENKKYVRCGSPEYRIKCLFDGYICRVRLNDFDIYPFQVEEGGILDYRTEWRQ